MDTMGSSFVSCMANDELLIWFALKSNGMDVMKGISSLWFKLIM